MIFPLMPKGVEHFSPCVRNKPTKAVIFPLMPKGVEHSDRPTIWFPLSLVIFPLMPKGVEHSMPAVPMWLQTRDFPSDAERR